MCGSEKEACKSIIGKSCQRKKVERKEERAFQLKKQPNQHHTKNTKEALHNILDCTQWMGFTLCQMATKR